MFMGVFWFDIMACNKTLAIVFYEITFYHKFQFTSLFAR